MGAEWFAGRLKEVRKQAGLTQRALADKAGVHVDAIARWEAGRREPSWGNVLALAAALGVGVEAFAVAPKDKPAPLRGRPRKPQAPEDTPAEEKTAPQEPKKPVAKKGRRKQKGQ